MSSPVGGHGAVEAGDLFWNRNTPHRLVLSWRCSVIRFDDVVMPGCRLDRKVKAGRYSDWLHISTCQITFCLSLLSLHSAAPIPKIVAHIPIGWFRIRRRSLKVSSRSRRPACSQTLRKEWRSDQRLLPASLSHPLSLGL